VHNISCTDIDGIEAGKTNIALRPHPNVEKFVTSCFTWDVVDPDDQDEIKYIDIFSWFPGLVSLNVYCCGVFNIKNLKMLKRLKNLNIKCTKMDEESAQEINTIYPWLPERQSGYPWLPER
jgi:hypothetical protein